MVCSGTISKRRGLEVSLLVVHRMFWECGVKSRAIDMFYMAYFEQESTKEEKHQKRRN